MQVDAWPRVEERRHNASFPQHEAMRPLAFFSISDPGN